MANNPLYDFAPDETAEQPLPVAFDPNLRRVVIDTTPRTIARNLIGENQVVQELPGGDPLVVGSNPTERMQTWPERMLREGLTAPGEVYEKGLLPPGLRREDFTDKPVPDGWTVANSPADPSIEAAMATAALAGGGGIAGTGEGAGMALGSSPILRPALKYKDKIYKAPAGGEHLDALPKELQAEFNQMAMSGEDISHFNFGFMNHKGQFLNREAALDYGIEHGLVSPDAKKYGVLTSTLMADSSKPGVAIEAMKPAPAFYSAVEHTVNNAKINKASPQEWLSYLKNQPGVKQEELQWLGLDELKGKQISKAELEQHIADHKVELKENSNPTYQGNEKNYAQWQLPGAENYREMTMTLPKNSLEPIRNKIQSNNNRIQELRDSMHGTSGSNEIRTEISKLHDDNVALKSELNTTQSSEYRSSHWDEPNILAHVRMNDRVIDGKKSLHLEEIQSDWHQQGRDKGYKGENETKYQELMKQRGDLQKEASVLSPSDARYKEIYKDLPKLQTEINKLGVGVPNAPFKKNWDELALKRVIRHAAENGYDQISWTPGEAQAARYDLSKSIDKLVYNPETGHLQGFKDKRMVLDNPNVPKDKLPDFVGKEAAEKIIDKPTSKVGVNGSYHQLENADLKVGGEGMKGFYDKILVDRANALGKKFGAKVEKGEIESGNHILPEGGTITPDRMYLLSDRQKATLKPITHPVHVLPLTPGLRDTALQKGFPLFSSSHAGMTFTPIQHDPFRYTEIDGDPFVK
jgi:hypothetical protein